MFVMILMLTWDFNSDPHLNGIGIIKYVLYHGLGKCINIVLAEAEFVYK